MKKDNYKLSDEVWEKVVQLIQLSMLTGTDVVDYFRQLQVEPSETPGMLSPTVEYAALFDKTIAELMKRVVKMQEEKEGLNPDTETNVDLTGEVQFGMMDENGVLQGAKKMIISDEE